MLEHSRKNEKRHLKKSLNLKWDSQRRRTLKTRGSWFQRSLPGHTSLRCTIATKLGCRCWIWPTQKASFSQLQCSSAHCLIYIATGSTQHKQRDSDYTQVGNMEVFLFEIHLTQKDMDSKKLLVPMELALGHFPYLANRQCTYTETMQISNSRNNSMLLTVSFDVQESAFVIGSSTWWLQNVSINKLKAKDSIWFYRPLYHSRDQHYLMS